MIQIFIYSTYTNADFQILMKYNILLKKYC